MEAAYHRHDISDGRWALIEPQDWLFVGLIQISCAVDIGYLPSLCFLGSLLFSFPPCYAVVP